MGAIGGGQDHLRSDIGNGPEQTKVEAERPVRKVLQFIVFSHSTSKTQETQPQLKPRL